MSMQRAKARELAQEFLQRNDPLGWFEALYAQAEQDASGISWADLKPNPNLLAWLERKAITGGGKRALKIGCGLGDDAEELARRGFGVTAFDIAPSAIAWCLARFPHSPVAYHIADLFHAPSEWRGAFDLVLEAYTLQVLPSELRGKAMARIAEFVAPGGTLLVICRGRSAEDSTGQMPWPLLRDELNTFTHYNLHECGFEEYFDQEEPPVRRFRVQYLKKFS